MEVRKTNTQSEPLRSDTSYTRLAFGLHTTISQRHAKTAFEVRNVPHFSNVNACFSPSPQEFILGSLEEVIPCYFFLDLSTLNGPLEDALNFESRVSDFDSRSHFPLR